MHRGMRRGMLGCCGRWRLGEAPMERGGSGRATHDGHLSDDEAVAKMGHPASG
jgi:hypothetical protein